MTLKILKDSLKQTVKSWYKQISIEIYLLDKQLKFTLDEIERKNR